MSARHNIRASLRNVSRSFGSIKGLYIACRSDKTVYQIEMSQQDTIKEQLQKRILLSQKSLVRTMQGILQQLQIQEKTQHEPSQNINLIFHIKLDQLVADGYGVTIVNTGAKNSVIRYPEVEFNRPFNCSYLICMPTNFRYTIYSLFRH